MIAEVNDYLQAAAGYYNASINPAVSEDMRGKSLSIAPLLFVF
jgi:hypothetical protein